MTLKFLAQHVADPYRLGEAILESLRACIATARGNSVAGETAAFASLRLGGVEGRKRKRGVVDKSVEPEPAWVAPPEVYSRDVTIPLDREVEIVGRFGYDARDQLIDFALVLRSTPEDGDPVEVAKVDCRHSTVHFHSGDCKDEMRDIRSASDIQAGYHEGWDRLVIVAKTL